MPHPEPATTTPPGDALPVGTLVDGRYRITGKIGHGGFAMVYSAIHEGLGRSVALKVLDLHGNRRDMATFHERFRREAQFAGTIRHDHVVHVHDFGVVAQNNQPYVAMDLLQGHDLEKELQAHGPLEPTRAMRLFDGALSGLAAAHALGIVHKDLKPSNLFLVHPGTPKEKMVVLDFGIARMYEDPSSKLTKTNQYTGTPAYAAPEYISHHLVSPALDVYQMGLIVAESLTGVPVVQANSSMAFFIAHCHGQHHIPDTLLQTPLGQLLAQAISVDPHLRPQDAEAFRRALAQVPPPLLLSSSSAPPSRPAAPVSSPVSFAPTGAGEALAPHQAHKQACKSHPQPVTAKGKAPRPLKTILALALATFCVVGCALGLVITALLMDEPEGERGHLGQASRGALGQMLVAGGGGGAKEGGREKRPEPRDLWLADARAMALSHVAIGILWGAGELSAIGTAKAPEQGTREELLAFWKRAHLNTPGSIVFTHGRNVLGDFLRSHSPGHDSLAGAMEVWSEHLTSVENLEEQVFDYWKAPGAEATTTVDVRRGQELVAQKKRADQAFQAHSARLFKALYAANEAMLQRASDTEIFSVHEQHLASLLLEFKTLHLRLMKEPRSAASQTALDAFAAQNLRLRAKVRKDGSFKTMDAVFDALLIYLNETSRHVEEWQGTPHAFAAFSLHAQYMQVMQTYFMYSSQPPLPSNPSLLR